MEVEVPRLPEDIDRVGSGKVELLLPPPSSERSDWACPFSPASLGPDCWMWNSLQSAHPEKLILVDDATVVFHPVWSNSTAGVRGTRLLNGGMYYWEIAFGSRVFGSAMMVGVSTPAGRLESRDFEPIIGEDEHSWGLSHTGHIFHNGKKHLYCPPFQENVPTVVGVLFDGRTDGRTGGGDGRTDGGDGRTGGGGGTLTFFKDGVCLGLAFSDINPGRRELYPMVSSTAAKTSMRVQNMRRGHHNLRDRCRDVILRSICRPADAEEVLKRLPLSLRRYVSQQAWKIGRHKRCERDKFSA
ncbi:hypothetical protein BV898_01940 [Hypsibius exemplaris]|uniref:B30.2/SPRY domain-containing protein n=1 Tax=Hypsibius exemplaris TaxID=2072580 RepID=A0A1W0XA55_HYPEX|nr:hypothetical protein BV898_01940 [Hypsibius exemplaris]